MLTPFLESGDGGPLLDLALRSLDLFDGFVQRVSAESGLAVAYRRSGSLSVVTDAADVSELRASAEALERRGIQPELLDGHAARLEEPQLAPEVIGGLVVHAHGFVSAPELTRAAATAARRCGAQLVENNRVMRIARVKGDMVVETNRGALKADAVVLAAGSWSGGIPVQGVSVRPPVRPVRGQLVQLSWPTPRLRRIVWSPKVYLVPRDDGVVLVGATTEDVGFDERVTVAGVQDLLESACAICPGARVAGFIEARVGLRPGTADDLPLIGPSRVVPNLFYATGHYRSGVMLAPLTAQLIADALLDKTFDPAAAAVSPTRFGDL